jgi:hypothetical protein
MDSARVSILRDLLAGTGWVERTRNFGRALRKAPHDPGGLLVVGTPTEDPWHFAAHLDDEARWSDRPNMVPILVRWSPPPGAPPHLSVGLRRLEQIGRGETVFVVAPDAATAPLLERIADARKIGATVFAMDAGDVELEGLAHESLRIPARAAEGIVVPDFDVVSHLVSTAAGETASAAGGGRLSAVRRRLAKMLDAVSDSDSDDDDVAPTRPPR